MSWRAGWPRLCHSFLDEAIHSQLLAKVRCLWVYRCPIHLDIRVHIWSGVFGEPDHDIAPRLQCVAVPDVRFALQFKTVMCRLYSGNDIPYMHLNILDGNDLILLLAEYRGHGEPDGGQEERGNQ